MSEVPIKKKTKLAPFGMEVPSPVFFSPYILELLIIYIMLHDICCHRQSLSDHLMMRMTRTQMMITVMMRSYSHQLMMWTLLYSL